jgi:hypothetical protein
MPFIVGCGRSGTTLLRMMLDSHPEMAIPPETEVVVAGARAGDNVAAFCDSVTGHWRFEDLHIDAHMWRRRVRALVPFTVAGGLREMYRMYAEKFGKSRYGDKTPFYSTHLPLIASLFPEARAIHVIRDGRDVAASMMPLWFSPGDARATADHWCQVITQIRSDQHILPTIEVRYENLVVDPEAELCRVLEFCELDWCPDVMRYFERADGRISEVTQDAQTADGIWLASVEHRHRIHRLVNEPPCADRVGAWRTELAPVDRAAFEDRAGWLLDELGMR